jgi:2'-5' RNA ligase
MPRWSSCATALGSFPSGVLFVAPGDCPALRVLQRDAYDTLRRRWPPAFGRQSAPDDWTPHCTLATRLRSPELRALRASAFEPFPATVDTLTVIAVGGWSDLARCRLG